MLAGSGGVAQTTDNSPAKPETQAAAVAPTNAAQPTSNAANADSDKGDAGSATASASDQAAPGKPETTNAAEGTNDQASSPKADSPSAAEAPRATAAASDAGTPVEPVSAEAPSRQAQDGETTAADRSATEDQGKGVPVTTANDQTAQPNAVTGAAQPAQDDDHAEKTAAANADAVSAAPAHPGEASEPATPAQSGNPPTGAKQTGENQAGENQAGENPTGNKEAAENQSGKLADKDFGRLSQDGADAFEDIHLARLAIFDGRTGQAAKLVADAQAALEKAKADDSVFTKAEAELHAARRGPTAGQSDQQDGSTKVAWLPIDAQIDVGEAYQPTPEKDAAIVTARRHMEKGESAKALQELKVAAVDVDYTLEVAPLARSIANVDRANDLMNSHDYYGASQALKKAEDGIRYDEISDVFDVAGTPKTASTKTDKSAD
jgi:hypothetical protein